MKRNDALLPYDNYWIYNPVVSVSSGRRVCVLVSKKDGCKTSISYARYLMSVAIGRILDSKEFVDHKDEDKLNDDILNLQILSRGDNNRKYRICAGIKPVRFKFRCPSCKCVFEKDKRQSHLSKGGVFTACSRSCAGKIRAMMGHGFFIDVSGNVIGEIKDP